jgi:hypothetical protein
MAKTRPGVAQVYTSGRRQQQTALTLATAAAGLLALWAGRAAAASDVPAAPAAADVEFFESRVRPVLVEHCYKCHSAGSESLKGGLRLDSRDGLLRGGESGPGVVPGDPAKSRLVAAIRYDDPDLEMPPKTRLSDRQIADLTEWVARGAPWPAEAAPAGGAPGAGSVEAFDLWKRRAAHWAWQPVRAHDPPAVRDAAWPRGPVDRFILAKLEQQNLAPAAPADRNALLRRVYFALTGLPPSPEELESFLADTSPDALEKVVDRLLASPRYGERWGRHWLDVVRYSDTLGNETDLPIHNAWRYRDYVIRAFNADVPYDRLVLEHLAGDLLPQPRRHPTEGFNESVIGTAFYWLGEGKRSPVDLRLAQADTFDNQIDVTCKAFMAMTVSCARCHDHKFDAIPTADYYALYGYLKSSRYTQAQVNRAELDARAAELASLRSAIREAAGAALRTRAGSLSRYLLAAEELRAGARPAAEIAAGAGLDPPGLERWAAALKEPADPSHAMFAWQRIAESGGVTPAGSMNAKWQSLRQESKAIADAVAMSSAPREGDVELADFRRAGFKEWLPEDQSFGAAPLKPGDFLLGADAARPVATFVRDGAWAHSAFLSPKLEGTLRSPSFTIDRRYLHVLAAGHASRVNVVIDHFVMIQDPLYGTLRRALGDKQWHTFDLGMWQGRRAYVEFADTTTPDLHAVGAPVGVGPDGHVAVSRVLMSPHQAAPPSPAVATIIDLFGGEPVDSLAALAQRYQRVVDESLDAFTAGRLDSLPDAEPRAALLAWLVERGLLDPGDAERQALDSLFQQFRAVESQLPAPQRVPAMADGTPDEEHVFVRGNPKTLAPAPEPRRMLQAVCGPVAGQAPAPQAGSGRLDLARRVADPANPLTARVMVNRVWHHVFGRGLVASVDNFGALGEQPSHPELLDYLAGRFVREGWSVKRLVRELVLGSAFRMSSTAAALEADAADPDNRLLHRMPVRRLEAEAIRDQVLAVSGRLDVGRMYGPGVEIFLTPYMDTYADHYGRPQTSGPLDGDGRRSLYVMVRRNFLTPMLVAFDAPPPLKTEGRRTVSNVPAQALIMMNDPFIAEQSKRWAARVLARADLDAPGRIRHMYLQAYSRPPTEEELAIALGFVERQGAELGVAEGERATDPRVWADLAHVLMNVKEFIFLN